MGRGKQYEIQDSQELPMVAEATFAYGTTKMTIDQILSDKLNLVMHIKAGLPYQFYKVLQRFISLNEEEWASALGISTKSLQRYKTSETPFKSAQSEKLIGMAEIIKRGHEVFGNKDKFELWLRQSSFALGGMAPIELLQDSYGRELVLKELNNIEHGIFA
jgi:putative toxin-antitoxin system antitoxin component (TIGR02293 family)